jgi:nitroimidazol reductase NimA-like FMN-containing flavoprotein (pyridoxamine 5'-phosphate oxidase superfamily)/GNAT superfamily N-acetyltransferase
MTRNQESVSSPAGLTPTPRSTPKRRAARGSHERLLIDAILDEALVCHVAVSLPDGPHVLPTAHVRVGDRVYLHGARANHLLRAALGAPTTLAVTLIDGIVFSRESFHHSMNYRSVVLFGTASEVADLDEKLTALRALVEHIAPGRYAEALPPKPEEVAATLVLSFPIEEGSAKVRTGMPIDQASQANQGIWAGVLPLALQAGSPQPDSLDAVAPPLAASVRERAVAFGLGKRAPYERSLERDLVLSTDPARLDLTLVHQFLSLDSYWAQGVSEDAVRRSCTESLCFGLYRGRQQLAFARVITDFARIAYLGDVFVIESERASGLGKLLVSELLQHPDIERVERWILGTRDAHSLYARHGFVPVPEARYMVRRTDTQ